MAQKLTVSDFQLALEASVECGALPPLQATQKFSGMLNRQTQNGYVSVSSAKAELAGARRRFFEKAVKYI